MAALASTPPWHLASSGGGGAYSGSLHPGQGRVTLPSPPSSLWRLPPGRSQASVAGPQTKQVFLQVLLKRPLS